MFIFSVCAERCINATGVNAYPNVCIFMSMYNKMKIKPTTSCGYVLDANDRIYYFCHLVLHDVFDREENERLEENSFLGCLGNFSPSPLKQNAKMEQHAATKHA